MAYAKAQAMARDLVTRLQISIAGITVAQFLDADGFPTIRVLKSTEVVGIAKIEMFGNYSRIDSLGLNQRAYSPHIIKLAQEDVAGSTVPTAFAERAQMLAELVRCGCGITILEKDGLANTETDVDTIGGLTQLCVINSDAINPVLSSQ